MSLETRTPAPDGRPAAEQPCWRHAFPIDVPQDNYIARRDFTRFLGLISLAFVVGQFWIALQSWFRNRRGLPPVVRIGPVNSIPVGGATTFAYPEPGAACLLVRTGADTFVAYDQKCTHLSCAVRPKVAEAKLDCPCHHGTFDLATGRPLAGPPRRPLTRILLEVRGPDLYAVGVEARTV